MRRAGDQWEDGAAGQVWKSRDLDERRALATEFLTNVNQRVPIHNAIRERCIAQKRAIDECARSAHDACSAMQQADSVGAAGALQAVQQSIDELTADENIGDTLKYIAVENAALLDDEVLGSGAEDMKVLRSWLKHRRSTADYQSYMSIPAKERNAWSAWYLRHVQGKPGVDE